MCDVRGVKRIVAEVGDVDGDDRLWERNGAVLEDVNDDDEG